MDARQPVLPWPHLESRRDQAAGGRRVVRGGDPDRAGAHLALSSSGVPVDTIWQ